MSFPPFPPPPGPPGQLPPIIPIPFGCISLNGVFPVIPVINKMIESGEIKITQNNIKREDNNLFQISRWLNYEIDDKELYERIIEAE